MRNRIFAVLALAVAAGGGLAYATYNYMQSAPVRTVSTPTQPVVVAAADLALATELKADDLRVVQWPKGQAPEGVFTNASELVGRGLVASVVRNEPILPGKLAPMEAGSGLPPVIPPGMRAVSVRVNEVIGVAGYVLPGTHVDVVATVNAATQGTDTTTKVVLSNIQVLTAGTRLEQDQKDGKPVQVTVVTLLVTPEQAERLALASTEGKVQLALRNPLDKTEPETPGIRPATLMGTVAAAKPAPRQVSPSSRPRVAPRTQMVPAEPPAPTIEIIRGDKRTQEVIK
ncbi:MAG TPA: Flp pilus assembly protein CpaB [Vicinamibacterales bacterium]|nr:Flp pilus assembly protein CpaB [Vicinamibacterales bacterium]